MTDKTLEKIGRLSAIIMINSLIITIVGIIFNITWITLVFGLTFTTALLTFLNVTFLVIWKQMK